MAQIGSSKPRVVPLPPPGGPGAATLSERRPSEWPCDARLSPGLEGLTGPRLTSLAIASSRSFTFRHEIQTPRVVLHYVVGVLEEDDPEERV